MSCRPHAAAALDSLLTVGDPRMISVERSSPHTMKRLNPADRNW
jgi:hypothetical protein